MFVCLGKLRETCVLSAFFVGCCLFVICLLYLWCVWQAVPFYCGVVCTWWHVSACGCSICVGVVCLGGGCTWWGVVVFVCCVCCWALAGDV